MLMFQESEVGLSKRPDRAILDYETRSACPLKKTGAWKYSEDPTTEILCAAIRMPYWRKGRVELWHPAFPHLGMAEEGVDALVELFSWILSGGMIEAHSAQFEKCITQNIAVPRYGWPPVPASAWRCSAAKAAAHSLPRNLGDLTAALGLKIQKDLAGSKVMQKMNKPRKPRKAEVAAWVKERGDAPMPLLYHESVELFETLFAYCRQDVLAEEAASDVVPDLSEAETQMYLLDQTINERGFLLDMDAVSVALELINSESTRLNDELCLLTGGSPDKATKRKKMHDWFLNQWFILEDTKGPTVDAALKDSKLDQPHVRRGLELLQSLSRSSTAKYEAMRNHACRDGRVRGGLLYHGASTGRWSGSGVQPHNFPRGSVKDIERAWAVLKTQDRNVIEAFDQKVKAA